MKCYLAKFYSRMKIFVMWKNLENISNVRCRLRKSHSLSELKNHSISSIIIHILVHSAQKSPYLYMFYKSEHAMNLCIHRLFFCHLFPRRYTFLLPMSVQAVTVMWDMSRHTFITEFLHNFCFSMPYFVSIWNVANMSSKESQTKTTCFEK